MAPLTVQNGNNVQLPDRGSSFGALFEASFDMIGRYANLLVDDDLDAETILFDVYRTAWHNRDGLLGDGAPLRWLLSATLDCTSARLAKRPRSASYRGDPATGHAADIRHSIRSLTAIQQQVVLLRCVASLSAEKTGRHLAIKPRAVRALQLHALRHLREVLDLNDPGGDDSRGHDAHAAADRAYWETQLPHILPDVSSNS